MTEREAKIRAVVNSLTQTEHPDLIADQPLFDSGILDSFALPDLVSALEQEFGIAIPDSDLRPLNFSSIRKIDTYVQAHQG